MTSFFSGAGSSFSTWNNDRLQESIFCRHSKLILVVTSNGADFLLGHVSKTSMVLVEAASGVEKVLAGAVASILLSSGYFRFLVEVSSETNCLDFDMSWWCATRIYAELLFQYVLYCTVDVNTLTFQIRLICLNLQKSLKWFLQKPFFLYQKFGTNRVVWADMCDITKRTRTVVGLNWRKKRCGRP